MKNVLIPIDFTDVGVNALRYALKAFPKSQVSVLHVKTLPIDINESIADPQILQTEFWEKALKKFIRKELKVDALPSRVAITVLFGPIVSTIKTYSKDTTFDAIIMGTRDKYNFLDRWFGTISESTVKGCELPVYLIPKYATYNGFNQVMIASDDHLTDGTIIQRIADWNKDYKAFIKFLHIQRSKNESFEKGTKTIVHELFANMNPDFSFEVAAVNDKDISHSLLASAYNMKADLLLVIPEDQNYIQSILFKSISKDLILQSDIPLLFIKKTS